MEEETLKTVDVNDRAAYSNGHHEHIVKQSLITFVNIYWTKKIIGLTNYSRILQVFLQDLIF